MILALWLLAWVVISWAGIQDDALIHLRYAENLARTHTVTYDGVHPNYGASSLLYICILAVLHSFHSTPDLPRILSSVVHLLLWCGLSELLRRAIPPTAVAARVLALALLCLIVTPSAVRWLDDGMETGLVLCFVTGICLVASRVSITTRTGYAACVVLGLFAVLLRTELLLLCGLSTAILAWNAFPEHRSSPRAFVGSILRSSHLLLGGSMALLLIRWKMHYLLPDTALAKSDGVAHWAGTFTVTFHILIGALSFGAGICLLWLLTLLSLVVARRFTLATLLANLAFPLIFVAAAARGQQIQGVRYLVWTFFFSALWNLFELGCLQPRLSSGFAGQPWIVRLSCAFLVFCLAIVPFECRKLYPMLRDRAAMLRSFKAEHLEQLAGEQGIAFDIGYIGYFSHAKICDLAGLVNGRDKARLTGTQRLEACATSHPDFLFLDAGGFHDLQPHLALRDWQFCSRYSFRNVSSEDPHYLLVPRSNAAQLCNRLTGSLPSDIEAIPR